MSLYSNTKREFTIDPGCPWYEAQQKYGAPNVNWCEPTRCHWINEPVNAWSNLGFLLVAVWILKKFSDPQLRFFGGVVLVMGLFSAIYHATNNYLTQFFDFVGMALMTSFLLAFNARRLRAGKGPGFYSLYWFFSFLNMALLMVLDIADIPVQTLLLVNALPILALELCNGWREKSFSRYGHLAVAGVVLILAQVAAQVDLKRVYCEPENLLLHGHMIWHLLCALGMLFLALHIRKFPVWK